MGSLELPSSNGLDALPPRPPTPPREARHEPATSTRLVLAPADRQLNLQTPPSIYSPADSAATKSGSRKRVGFSSRAEYKEPAVYLDGEPKKVHHPTPVSLPSSTSKPVKSILKVTTYDSNPLDSSARNSLHPGGVGGDIPTMLESAIQHLAGSNRDSKVDAYLVLTQALKTTNNLPDRAAVAEQMGFFTQCIQRDITSKTPEGSLDHSLVNHALTLLSTFNFFTAVASAIPYDFSVFIVDHSIRSFEDPSSHKDMVRHLMQVVGSQNFSAKVMTADRVARLISALHKIEEHLEGKSIIMARVLIYRKLLKQCKNYMVTNSDWLLDLFTDMLSSVRDIRAAAILLGLDAGFSIGKEKLLTRKVMEVFNLTLEDKKYIKYYEERLDAMSKDKDLSAWVPRIWTVVILLLRLPIDKWESSKSWLRIIQACFNHSDFQTKVEANYAWSRLVYLTHFDERSFSKMVTTLGQPLETQLKRKGTSKTHEELRKIVIGGICNLFYYEFKPTTNLKLLDDYWDSSVEPLLTKLVERKPYGFLSSLSEGSNILSGLLDCTTKRVWKEDNAADNVMVQPAELPAIDSKWIRHNGGRVFALVEPILEQSFLELADKNSITFNLWGNLMRSVASAASKEIKVSMDTATFVARTFNVLHRMWQPGPGEDENGVYQSSAFLLAMQNLLEIMVQSLGLLPFTEKMLSMTKQNSFVPITTPSSRPGKHQAPPKPPLHHLFFILSTLPRGVPDDFEFCKFVKTVFEPFFTGKGEQAQRNMAQELLSSLPMDRRCPIGPWIFAMEKLAKWLEPKQSGHQPSGSDSQPLAGHDYREVVRVLERGVRTTPNLPWNLWESFMSLVAKRAETETGDAGVAIVLVEPLAKVILDQIMTRGTSKVSANSIRCLTQVVSIATQPRDRHAVEAARRRLWGTPNAGPRALSFDPFDNLYKAVNITLEYLYNESSEHDPGAWGLAVDFLVETEKFLGRCNVELVGRTIEAVQNGLSVWIKDEKCRVLSMGSLAMIVSVWETLSVALDKIPHLDQQLGSFEPLLCAAFGSRHRRIVNPTVAFWNHLFKDAEEIRYPEKLQPILNSLRPHVELVLPGLQSSGDDHVEQHLAFKWIGELAPPKAASTKSNRKSTPRTSSARGSNTPSSSAVPAKRSLEPTPTTKGPKSKRRSTTPRLRHDDSQIQFAAIQSSPTTDHEAESQLLTEHQQEVRERQKENQGLFPTLVSDPSIVSTDGSRIESSLPAGGPKSPDLPRAATPGREGSFEDFVTSTPTPRRGQLVLLPEHCMNDPPSSPPEPRGNPLADEIRSRSASNSIRDEWQGFPSSSPVSGSPTAARQVDAHTPSRRTGTMAEMVLPEVEEEEEDIRDALGQECGLDDNDLPELGPDETVAEASPVLRKSRSAAAAQSRSAAHVPSTPRHEHEAVEIQETPKSADEVFVDALSSPQLRTPRRSARTARDKAKQPAEPKPAPAADASFEVSEIDESSLLKLVVELDSRSVNPTDYRVAMSSPGEEIRDAIVVGGTPQKSRRAGSRKVKSSPLRPSTSFSQAEELPAAKTQPKGRGAHKKRKRGASKTAEPRAGSSKRHKAQEPSDEAEEEAPSSQLASILEETASTPGEVSRQGGREESPDLSVGPLEASFVAEEMPPQVVVQSPADEAMEDIVESSAAEQETKMEQPKPLEAASLAPGGVAGSHAVREAVPESPLRALAAASEAQQPEEGQAQTDKAQEILDQLQSAMAAMQGANLSRDKVYRIEDMMMDLKRELYEAEKRGRAD